VGINYGREKPIKVFIAKAYTATVKAIADTYSNGETSKVAILVVDKEGAMRAMKDEPGALAFFNDRDKLSNFEPKFFESDASIGTWLVIKKSARPEVRKAFVALTQK
jgi:hypothetical protein